jgi:putative ABC transport system permease protein
MLTLIGIFIGIAAVVSLISLGQGLQNSIEKQFETLGTNKIIVQAGSSAGFNPTSIKLFTEDIEAINSVSGVDEVGSAVYKIARIKFHDETKYSWVLGIDTGSAKDMVLESFGVNIENGRGISSDSDVLIGHRFWTADFFDSDVRTGDKLSIEEKKFHVSGEIEKIGNPQDDSQLYLSLDAARDVLNIGSDEVDFIIVTVDKNEKPSVVAEKIKKELRKTRDVEEGEEDFNVQTTEDFMKTFGTILLIVQLILIGIAGVSLLVGGVNITNTIYTSVLERTNEIGIMKAIGARNKDIFCIFLVEAGILGFVGGIIGVIIGVILSKSVALAAEAGGWGIIQAAFSPYLLAGALLFAFIVGAAAGAIPAYQASKMKPVDALRYE